MSIAMLTLSAAGARVIEAARAGFDAPALYLHHDVEGFPDFERFDSVIEITAAIFGKYDQLVYVMPCGVVVRALSGLPGSKHTDPAVVMLDVGARYAISLLSGHEGGANELAFRIANLTGAEPVVSTTTEAVKTIIVGVGCRRGTSADDLVAAIEESAQSAGIGVDEIRCIASADIKFDEIGLIEAGRRLNIPLRFMGSDEIRNTRRAFTCSELTQDKVGLPAVSEPAALLAGRRTELILPRTIYNGITVAIARERCTSLE